MLIKSNLHNLRYITLRLSFTTFPSYFFYQPENVFGLTTYLRRPKHLKKGKHFRETHLRRNKRAVRFGTLGLYPVYIFSSNNPPFPPHPWRTTRQPPKSKPPKSRLLMNLYPSNQIQQKLKTTQDLFSLAKLISDKEVNHNKVIAIIRKAWTTNVTSITVLGPNIFLFKY
jgi:hypothetical protein